MVDLGSWNIECMVCHVHVRHVQYKFFFFQLSKPCFIKKCSVNTTVFRRHANIRPETSRRRWRQPPPCPWSLPFKTLLWNVYFLHWVALYHRTRTLVHDFTKEKLGLPREACNNCFQETDPGYGLHLNRDTSTDSSNNVGALNSTTP